MAAHRRARRREARAAPGRQRHDAVRLSPGRAALPGDGPAPPALADGLSAGHRSRRRGGPCNSRRFAARHSPGPGARRHGIGGSRSARGPRARWRPVGAGARRPRCPGQSAVPPFRQSVPARSARPARLDGRALCAGPPLPRGPAALVAPARRGARRGPPHQVQRGIRRPGAAARPPGDGPPRVAPHAVALARRPAGARDRKPQPRRAAPARLPRARPDGRPAAGAARAGDAARLPRGPAPLGAGHADRRRRARGPAGRPPAARLSRGRAGPASGCS